MKALILTLVTIIGTVQIVLAKPIVFTLPHDPTQCPNLSGHYHSIVTYAYDRALFYRDGNGIIHFKIGDATEIAVIGHSKTVNPGESEYEVAAGCSNGTIRYRYEWSRGPGLEETIVPTANGFKLFRSDVTAAKEYIKMPPWFSLTPRGQASNK